MFINCHSWFSLRYGTLSVDSLLAIANRLGIKALALTDINATTGVYDFIMECREYGIKPIIGIDFRNQNDQLFIALAKNNEGFREMNELVSQCNRAHILKPSRAPDWKYCYVVYPFDKAPDRVGDLKDYEYIGICAHELHKFRTSKWYQHQDRVVILHPVTIQSLDHHKLHILLRAIDNNELVSKLKKDEVVSQREFFISEQKLEACFEHFPQIISNTKRILDQCHFSFDFKTPKNKKVFTTSRYNDKELLQKLAFEGMRQRYGSNNEEAKRLIQKEIDIIDKLHFSGYFLITWDIIRYSMSRGYFHVGRGSGANSIVSYCLKITDICPIELNLYFERFLNPARKSPPDFDIDWSWMDRDDILDYIFTRFEDSKVAFTGTVGKFKHRSIFRELGKAFGLPKEELDQLSKNQIIHHPKSNVVQHIHKYAQLLSGFPNQRSMHACGILISEEPLTYYTSLDMYPKGFQTAQFDMYTAEEIGFEKLDILSQRGLGHINDSLQIIKENKGVDVDIYNVNTFKKDEEINKRLGEGLTLGCFYIESPAMRGLLRRLNCNDYLTLVAASSVIRPGVAKSGMMREYIFRHNNPDDFEYFHDVFEEHLKDTYGVMVYQEDVIKIAHHFASLDYADADILRRAMTGKTRSKREFENVKRKYYENCKAKGYSDKLIKEVYRQIESFAGYSFCKSHSASYAVESYQSLYLKTYFPIEFSVAVINNFGGFYRTEVYIHEARMSGGILHCPCINQSNILTTLYDKNIYLGFVHIENLERAIRQEIVDERRRNGNYKSLEDFIDRVAIGIESLQTLIFIGAFQFTGKPKSRLILEARMLLAPKAKKKYMKKLFHTPVRKFNLPDMPRSKFEDAYDELELLGFTISCSPFELLKTKYRGDVMVKELIGLKDKTVKMLGYLISRKNVPTTKGNMNFGTWIDVEGAYFDTTHFVDCLKRYPFQGGGCYLLLGKVDIDFNFPSVVIEKMAKLPFVSDPRYEDDQDKKFDIHGHFKENYSGTSRAPYPREHEIGLPRTKME